MMLWQAIRQKRREKCFVWTPSLSAKAGPAQVQGHTEECQGALGVFEQIRSSLEGGMGCL